MATRSWGQARCLGLRATSWGPDLELHMYDGYGHAAYVFAPDYKERLLRFFTA